MQIPEGCIGVNQCFSRSLDSLQSKVEHGRSAELCPLMGVLALEHSSYDNPAIRQQMGVLASDCAASARHIKVQIVQGDRAAIALDLVMSRLKDMA